MKAVLVLLLWAALPLAAQPEGTSADTEAAAADTTVAPDRPSSPYGIFRTHLPDSPGGPQVAVPLGRYVANVGARDGVKAGSIFAVYSGALYVGLLRVERVYADSSSLRLVNLERKLNPESPQPIVRGMRLYPRYVRLESINFGTGAPAFTADMHERLRHAARFILNFPDYPVLLEGHTDNTGKKSGNVKLAIARARTIREYLHDIQLVPRTQMFSVGYADERPIVSNDTEEGRRRNRRVDVVMVDELPPEAVAEASRTAAVELDESP